MNTRLLLFSKHLQPGWEYYVVRQVALMAALATVLVVGLEYVGARAGLFPPGAAVMPLLFVGAVVMWFHFYRKYHIYASTGVACGVVMPASLMLTPPSTLGELLVPALLGAWIAVRGYSCGPKMRST